MDLVLFGPPGAGKGTQAKHLTVILGHPQLSTGDLMRAERASGSALGERFNGFMSQGRLVPDELVAELVKKRLSQPDAQEGAVFDGYPRTLDQASLLDDILEQCGRAVDHVVSLEVPLEHILDRVSGRRVCQSCGQVYHIRYNPPPASGACGSCGSTDLIQRSDDAESVVRKRFEEYLDKTAPVLDFYKNRGLVRTVNGVGDVEAVTERVRKSIEQ